MDVSLNVNPKHSRMDASTIGAHGSSFLAAVRSYPLLEQEQEYVLAKSWREHHEHWAAHQLVTSHLRLVVKVATQYRGYGLPASELISEGSVGLMHAVNRFEPDRGCRFATYAIWWIRASMHEYVLRSWSLVKIGTTASQKKLFFGLRKAKQQIAALEDGDLRSDHVEFIANRLGVTERDVVDMNRRLGRDLSLNAPVRDDADLGDWQDQLIDDAISPESRLAEDQETRNRRAALSEALTVLNTRERRIFEGRQLIEDPVTLEDLAAEFCLSRERVRQIEARAFEKVQKAVKCRISVVKGA